METHTFFLHLVIILISARIFAEIAVRLSAPPVIGELFAGVIIGPSLFGWVEPSDVIKLLAEIGIILLLTLTCEAAPLLRRAERERQARKNTMRTRAL